MCYKSSTLFEEILLSVSYLILFIDVPLKSVKVVLAVVAAQVMGISLWLWVGVGDVWDVGVVRLLQVLVAGLTIL